MNIISCNSGHFYDADKYGQCPHCNNEQQKNSVIIPEPEKPLYVYYNLTLTKKGFYKNKEIFFMENQIVVGKEPDVCQIILESIYGSRFHAKFVNQDGHWKVIDTNSTNGTKINGKQIESNKFYELHDKDEIAFSPTDIYIFIDKGKEDTVYCYNCGRKITKNNGQLPLICSFCDEIQEMVDKETTTLICDNCYNCNLVTDNFCRNCGKPLKASVINKLDYYICVYIPTTETYFNHTIE